jgi:hypothetical protein
MRTLALNDLLHYQTCVFYTEAPPCARIASLLRNAEKREGKRGLGKCGRTARKRGEQKMKNFGKYKHNE